MRWKGRVGEKTRKVKGGEWCRVSEIEWIGQAGGGDTIAQHMSLLPPPSTPPSFHFDDPPPRVLFRHLLCPATLDEPCAPVRGKVDGDGAAHAQINRVLDNLRGADG